MARPLGLARPAPYPLESTGRLCSTFRCYSSSGMAIRCGGPWYLAYGALAYSVATGQNAFRQVHGNSLFGYFAEHPDDSERFNQTMTTSSKKAVPAVPEAYDVS